MKIVVIGNGGSGKSHLANRIGADLDIKVTHLDKLTWQSNYEPIPKKEFMDNLEAEMEGESWIIEGWSHHDTLLQRLKAADVIIHLDFDLQFCLDSALRRNTDYNNKEYPYDPFVGNRLKMESLLKAAIEAVHNTYEPEARRWITDMEEEKLVFRFFDREELTNGYEDMIKKIGKHNNQ